MENQGADQENHGAELYQAPPEYDLTLRAKPSATCLNSAFIVWPCMFKNDRSFYASYMDNGTLRLSSLIINSVGASVYVALSFV
jgi:hypothetical protein